MAAVLLARQTAYKCSPGVGSVSFQASDTRVFWNRNLTLFCRYKHRSGGTNSSRPRSAGASGKGGNGAGKQINSMKGKRVGGVLLKTKVTIVYQPIHYKSSTV